VDEVIVAMVARSFLQYDEKTSQVRYSMPETTTTKATSSTMTGKTKVVVRLMLFGLACCAMVAAFAPLAILYSPLYTQVVLRPSREQSELYKIYKMLDARREEYFFDSSGTKLHGWLFRNPASNTVVVIHHGNAGNLINRLFLANKFLHAGTSVFLYDYSGYGKSNGNADLIAILNDGVAAFDFVKDNFRYPIVVNYGESIGSSVACHVDANRSASLLILQSGIASLPKIAKSKLTFLTIFPDIIWPTPQLDNTVLLARSKTPLLLIHGDRDTLVPIGHSRLLLDSAAAPDKQLVTLPTCGHNDVGCNDAALFQQTITDFLKRHGSTWHDQ